MGTNIIRMAKLDFALLKTYMGTVLLIIFGPATFFTFVQRSLTASVSFAMCAAAMTVSYVFSVEEKNSMERLFGILPVRKKEMVLGRYSFFMALGMASLIVSLLLQSVVLTVIGGQIEKTDCIMAFFLSVLLFALSTAFQLPGYYKFGSIKGRFFVYLPLAGFLLFSFGLERIMSKSVMSLSPGLFAVPAVLAIVAAYVISISVSVGIVEKKEA